MQDAFTAAKTSIGSHKTFDWVAYGPQAAIGQSWAKSKAKRPKHKKTTVRWTSISTELPQKTQKSLYRRATPQ